VVEGARLESEYTPKAYPGFESLPLRQSRGQIRSTRINAAGRNSRRVTIVCCPIETAGKVAGSAAREVRKEDSGCRLVAASGLLIDIEQAVVRYRNAGRFDQGKEHRLPGIDVELGLVRLAVVDHDDVPF
jgi:hypothetical protein